MSHPETSRTSFDELFAKVYLSKAFVMDLIAIINISVSKTKQGMTSISNSVIALLFFLLNFQVSTHLGAPSKVWIGKSKKSLTSFKNLPSRYKSFQLKEDNIEHFNQFLELKRFVPDKVRFPSQNVIVALPFRHHPKNSFGILWFYNKS